jgi:hypothetical protein
MWLGLTVKHLAMAVQRVVFSIIGWHLRPIRSKLLTSLFGYFPNLKRWHVTMGTHIAAPLTIRASCNPSGMLSKG